VVEVVVLVVVAPPHKASKQLGTSVKVSKS
jgi:hypothetical protein